MVGNEDQPVDMVAGKKPQIGQFASRPVQRCEKRYGKTAPVCLLFHCCNQHAEERVADIGNDETDRIGAPTAQTPGMRVRNIVELANGVFDAGLRVRRQFQ